PLMHVDRHRVYVHAGVDPDLPLAAQDPEQLLWKIYKAPDQRGHGTRHVVHGHHQNKDGPVTTEGRTNLDTQAWYTGRLVIGVFDDEVAGGPVSLLEVHGGAAERLCLVGAFNFLTAARRSPRRPIAPFPGGSAGRGSPPPPPDVPPTH